MSYTVLARKYRPQRFSDVIGQDHVTRTLKNAISQGRIAHGYIFSGHRGIGKTTIARILAMALNCRSAQHPVPEPCGVCDSCVEIRAGNSVDVIEIDAATNRGIDEIRELRDAARYRPARDRYKIYILDEAHQITDAAFNALLKTLEEPPGHVIFMMATTQPEDIPQTIRSRCQHFSFHAVKYDEIVGQLKSIAQQEQIEADNDAIALLAEAGDGSMRDALSIMDQAIACCAGRLTAEVVRGLVGTVSSDTLEHIMDAVHRNSSEYVLRIVDKLIVEGQSPTHFARQMVRFLRNAMVAKVAGPESHLLQISSDERARVGRIAERFAEEDLARFLQIMLRTHGELGYRHEQRFHLELGLLKLVHAQRLLPVEQILSGAAPASTPQSSSGSGSRGSSTTTAAASARPISSGAPLKPDFGLGRSHDAPNSGSGLAQQADAHDNIAPPAVHFTGSPAHRLTGSSAQPLTSVIESTAPAAASMPDSRSPINGSSAAAAPAQALEPGAMTSALSGDDLRDTMLSELESSQRSLALFLETGEWKFGDGEIVILVAKSDKVIDMTLGAEGQRLLNSLATRLAGRATRIRVLPGGNGNGNGNGAATSAPRRPANASGARGRAMQDPIVRKMQEKFGAEIRTVIDLSADN
jgi:DNA polymerase-3 subunit gamma/tau